MNAELRQEIESATSYSEFINSCEFKSNTERTMLHLVNIVKILSSEIDRLEQEKVSHEKH